MIDELVWGLGVKILTQVRYTVMLFELLVLISYILLHAVET